MTHGHALWGSEATYLWSRTQALGTQPGTHPPAPGSQPDLFCTPHAAHPEPRPGHRLMA